MGKTEIEGIEDEKEVKRNEQAVKAWKGETHNGCCKGWSNSVLTRWKVQSTKNLDLRCLDIYSFSKSETQDAFLACPWWVFLQQRCKNVLVFWCYKYT